MNEFDKVGTLIDKAAELIEKRSNSSTPDFVAWHTSVLRFYSNRFGTQSVEYENFRKRLFYPSIVIPGTTDISNACVRDLKATQYELQEIKNEIREEMNSMKINNGKIENSFQKVFIIHGHDGELKEAVARIITEQGIEAIILNEQANSGRTIIEKIEQYSDVGAAVALFTCDDIGKKKSDTNECPRARQNVVFEAGFFMGKLGRDRVIIIAEKGIELPSDLHGVVYTDRDSWKIDVCKELKAIGYNVDMNKLF